MWGISFPFYLITGFLLDYTVGLRLPPNNRVQRDTWSSNSSCHCHRRCMALISCKYRCCSFSSKLWTLHLSFTSRKVRTLRQKCLNMSRNQVERLVYWFRCKLLNEYCCYCCYFSLFRPNLAAVSEDIFLCQAAGVSTAEPAAEAHSLASN